jgi:hypothetical protein
VLGDHVYDLLRRHAAVVHAVPGASITLCADGQPVLAVGHDLPSSTTHDVRTCSPCGFRAAVGRAHQMHTQGRQMSLLGLGADARIEVTLLPGSSGEVVDGDLVLAWISDRLVALTTTTLDPSTAAEALVDAGIDPKDVCCHDDQLLGATILHVDVPVAEPTDSGDVLDLLGRVRDVCAVAELLDAVGAAWSDQH